MALILEDAAGGSMPCSRGLATRGRRLNVMPLPIMAREGALARGRKAAVVFEALKLALARLVVAADIGKCYPCKKRVSVLGRFNVRF